jgi:iron complex outermembrane receptor protein
MRKLIFLSIVLTRIAYCQDTPTDTLSQNLQPVLIQAYNADRPLSEIPASIGYLNTDNLNRFSNTSILPAVNAIPGVRMEERSPGSYRFSIRGSLLRSPFGVRNIKVYWNGLPLTDGGGNTYLNLVDFGTVGNMEVIKGPGGSLYGAGTGGVVLLNSPVVDQAHWQLAVTAGSYGMRRLALSQQFKTKYFNLRIQYANQHADGYRENTEMTRHNINADVTIKVGEKDILAGTFFYSNLFYETPGGLTKTQYDENAKQARPAAGIFASAVDQKAAVYNKTPYFGISYDHVWSERTSTRLGVFGSKSGFKNPTIRNYEDRDESNFGARTTTDYAFGRELRSKLTFGAEVQSFKSPIAVYDNNLGSKGSLQTSDDLRANQSSIFAQSEFVLPSDFFLTVGGSLNYLHYTYSHIEPAPAISQVKNFNTVFSPRVALLKKISESLSIFTNFSRGFSPPSLAEVRPSTNAFNPTLAAETGNNVELGFRGNAFAKKILFDVTAYDFRLKDAIVIQRDASGADYYVNAGGTRQTGLEATLSFAPIVNDKGFISAFKVWNSYSYNHYRFDTYVNDANDYSGNRLTGVPPTVNTSGLDLKIKKRFYINATVNYVDHVPLNDANTSYAKKYILVGSRIGYLHEFINKSQIEIFFGIDNALDEKYSLGNDLNAQGGRFYNAAAPRNYYGGLRLRWAQ